MCVRVPMRACSWSTQLFKRFRNPKDKRDFVTAGVSVGVATAFNAPIGEGPRLPCIVSATSVAPFMAELALRGFN